MTQEQQETLNEMFLGKEDPDMAFKRNPKEVEIPPLPPIEMVIAGTHLLSKKGTAMTNNLKEALIKDFRQLYQKEFTTDWEVQRMVRELEVGVMSLDNVEALINQKEKEARIDELEQVPEDRDYFTAIMVAPYVRDRIKQLKEELKGGEQ